MNFHSAEMQSMNYLCEFGSTIIPTRISQNAPNNPGHPFNFFTTITVGYKQEYQRENKFKMNVPHSKIHLQRDYVFHFKRHQ